jgi:hypothetical protein
MSDRDGYKRRPLRFVALVLGAALAAVLGYGLDDWADGQASLRVPVVMFVVFTGLAAFFLLRRSPGPEDLSRSRTIH